MKSAFGVEHEFSKRVTYEMRPRTKHERQMSRMREGAKGAATGAVTSGVLTAAINAGRGRGKQALGAGAAMTGVGGVLGGITGATGKRHKYKMVRVEKSYASIGTAVGRKTRQKGAKLMIHHGNEMLRQTVAGQKPKRMTDLGYDAGSRIRRAGKTMMANPEATGMATVAGGAAVGTGGAVGVYNGTRKRNR